MMLIYTCSYKGRDGVELDRAVVMVPFGDSPESEARAKFEEKNHSNARLIEIIPVCRTDDEGKIRVHLKAKRWQEEDSGNTYHSVKVLVAPGRGVLGEPAWRVIGKIDFEYGYGRKYIETGYQLLKDRTGLSLEYGDREMNESSPIYITTEVEQVSKRSEL